MFDRARFKAELALNQMSTKELAQQLEMSEATLYRKMNGTSDFTRKEIQEICKILKIESPVEVQNIFFREELA